MTHSLIFMHDLVEWTADALGITLFSTITVVIIAFGIRAIALAIRGE